MARRLTIKKWSQGLYFFHECGEEVRCKVVLAFDLDTARRNRVEIGWSYVWYHKNRRVTDCPRCGVPYADNNTFFTNPLSKEKDGTTANSHLENLQQGGAEEAKKETIRADPRQ
jgi:hypothetical protein